ncbi:1025_t:CDS:2 [Rhizophagus irregularis]|nr:1025_t:CDS:2 [Rhizophagus irregularis]
MSSFISTSSSIFSSYFSKKDNKYDISVLIISFITFCALSTFCGIIFTVNFTGWFVITVIGGFIAKCRQELIKSLSGKKFKPEKEVNMLDHRLNSRHHFEEFRLSSSKEIPSIPSYRNKSNNNKSNSKSKLDTILSSFDFSFSVLPPSEYSTKRNEKRTKNIKQRHSPDIPSQLGPNRRNEWVSDVDYYPSERHSHQPKSKLSVTEKMIESTAAYRVGRKCNGWINGYSEEYAIKQKDSKSGHTSFTSYDDPFYSREPIKELNVRLDQERPKISKQERNAYNKSPAMSLQYARQYLTVLLTVKKEMNL